MPAHHPRHPDPELLLRARLRLVAWGTFLFCLSSGIGVGAFCLAPLAGGVAGAVVGLVAVIWLIPPLVREWDESDRARGLHRPSRRPPV